MSCRAEIFTNTSEPMLAVPMQAIITEEKRSRKEVNQYVFINDSGSAKKIKVSTGISDDSFQQIVSGIESGMVIITGPDKTLRHLKDGDHITLQNDDNTSHH